MPFFIYWPDGGLKGGLKLDSLSAHVDLMPTLVELCGLELPPNYETDGISLAKLLQGETDSLPARTVQFTYALGDAPPDKIGGCFARDKYRLFGNGSFYDVAADPLQQNPIPRADMTPEQQAARQEMVTFAAAHHALMQETVYPYDDPSVIGHPASSPITLNAMYGRRLGKQAYAFMPTVSRPTGRLHRLIVKAASAGEYKVSLYRWPQIWKWVGVPIRSQVGGGDKFTIDAQGAFLQFTDKDGDVLFEAKEAISGMDSECTFTVPNLPADIQMNLDAWFIDGDGEKICTPIEIKLTHVQK